jgi:hypothetical protein
MAKSGHIPWNKGKKGVYSEDYCRKLSESHKGKHPSEETKHKMSTSAKGKIKSQETRARMGAHQLGENNHNFGKHLSEETRKKLSESLKNPSEETRKKMSDAKKGKNHPMFGKSHSDASRRKMSESNKGRSPWSTGKHLPESTKQKIREANLGERSPVWNGGTSFLPYCPKFNNEFKERVRAFFGHTCQMCGHVWVEGEKKLAVHHVNYHKNACCDPSIKPLFVPLCTHPCHIKTNKHRDEWEAVFTQKIMGEFGGECYIKKEKEI